MSKVVKGVTMNEIKTLGQFMSESAWGDKFRKNKPYVAPVPQHTYSALIQTGGSDLHRTIESKYGPDDIDKLHRLLSNEYAKGSTIELTHKESGRTLRKVV